MARRWYSLMLALSLAFVVSGLSSAKDTKFIAVGFRAGVSAVERDEDFEQYEIFASYGLPWCQKRPRNWIVRTRLNATAGAIRGGAETGFISSVGPGIILSNTGDQISLDIGSRATFLSRSRFGRQTLGGRFHFTSYIGIAFQLGRNLGIGYRYQHMSNAGINKRNPGLNMHMFGISYRLKALGAFTGRR